jgi:hypothetical protein
MDHLWTSLGVAAAIAAHQAAVTADEAQFDEAGKCLDPAMASITQLHEQQVFEAFVDIACLTAADVQAKISYLLNGNVGFREAMLSSVCGWSEADENDFVEVTVGPQRAVRFFRSLQLKEAPA